MIKVNELQRCNPHDFYICHSNETCYTNRLFKKLSQFGVYSLRFQMERKNINRLVFHLNEISFTEDNERRAKHEEQGDRNLNSVRYFSANYKPSIYANYLDSTITGCNLSQSMLNN